MYIPRPFTVDTDIAHDLLRQVTVGQLVTATQTGPVATLMPWVPDLDSGSLVGHMARPNHQWQTPWRPENLRNVIASALSRIEHRNPRHAAPR